MPELNDLKKLWIKVKKPVKREPYFFDDYVYDISEVEDLSHCAGCRCGEPSETNKKTFKKDDKKV